MRIFILCIFWSLSPHLLFAQVENNNPEDSTATLFADTLKVGLHLSPPFIEKNAQGQFQGISIELWERIAEEMDIPFEYYEVSLPEIFEGLQNKHLDIAINPLTVTSKRMEEVSFSHPFFVSHSSIAVRVTSGWLFAWLFVMSFFSLSFLSIIGFLFVIILIFGTLLWIFERKVNKQEFGGGLKGLGNGIWWSAVTMTTVGYGDKSPKSLGGRIVAVIWMFSAIILISGFTASVASSLTINQMGANVGNIDDFKPRKMASVEGSASHTYLKNNFFRDVSHYPELKDGLEALNGGTIEGFVYDDPIMRYVINRDTLSNIEILPFKFDLQFYAFAFPKGTTELRDLISQKIIEFTEDTQWKVILSEYNLSEI